MDMTTEIDENTTPRQRRRARRLAAIRAAALDLLIAEGLDGFNVKKLADRVDLTPGALYRYFDSRDEILISVQLDVLDDFARYLRAVDASLDHASPLVRIVTLCRAYMALDTLQPERFRMISRLVSDPDPLFSDEAALPAKFKALELLGLLADAVGDAQQAGALGPADALRRAILAWSSLQGVIERKKLTRLTPETFDPGDLADELLQTLMIGWGAEPEAAREAIDHPTDPTAFETIMQEVSS